MSFDTDFASLDHTGLYEDGKLRGRVEGGRKAAQTRGHDELSRMGQMGGSKRQGTHNRGNEMKYLDQATGDSRRKHQSVMMRRQRVGGGISRDLPMDFSDDEDALHGPSMNLALGQKHRKGMSLSEMGRKGAAARWGKKFDEDEGRSRSSGGRRGGPRSGRNNLSHAQQNRRSMASKMFDQGESEDEDEEEGGRSSRRGVKRSRGKMSREEAGKKGADARWGKGGQSDEEDDDDENDDGSNGGGRGGRGGKNNKGMFGGMGPVEAGRLGGKSSGGRRSGGRGGQGGESEEEEEDDISNTGSSGRNGGKMSRQEAGKRGAEARWGKHSGGGQSDEEDDDDDANGGRHQRRGGGGRQGRNNSHHGSGGYAEDSLDDELDGKRGSLSVVGEDEFIDDDDIETRGSKRQRKD